MSNLTPTPRVDKNGVTVIRHMRPSAAASISKAEVPRVSAVDSDDSSMTPVQQKNRVIEILMDGEEPKSWRSYNAKTIKVLSNISDKDVLRQVLDLAVAADAMDDASVRRLNITFVASQLEYEMFKSIGLIHANLDLIPPEQRWDHAKITIADLSIRKHSESRVPHLVEHMAARDAYPIPNKYGTDGRTVIYGRSEACRVVNENPERIDDIIELLERGVAPDALREALFNTDFGESYSLKRGAL